jgi:hypothetical protein
MADNRPTTMMNVRTFLRGGYAETTDPVTVISRTTVVGTWYPVGWGEIPEGEPTFIRPVGYGAAFTVDPPVPDVQREVVASLVRAVPKSPKPDVSKAPAGKTVRADRGNGEARATVGETAVLPAVKHQSQEEFDAERKARAKAQQDILNRMPKTGRGGNG